MISINWCLEWKSIICNVQYGDRELIVETEKQKKHPTVYTDIHNGGTANGVAMVKFDVIQKFIWLYTRK